MDKPRAKQGRRQVDWLEIKGAYIADPSLRMEDVAKRFGIYLGTVRKHAMDEKWTDQRAELIAIADARMKERLVEERIRDVDEYNLEDIKFGRALRSALIDEYKKAKAAGKLDSKKLIEIATAHEKIQKTVRLPMGQNTNSNELSGKGGAPLNFAPPVINVTFPDSIDGAESA